MVSPIADTYRRFLIDMHIPDWDPDFLTQFDADYFFDALSAAKVATVTVPSNGHTGLCYWPTKSGRPHRNAPNLLGQMIDGAHARGLNAVIYYCTIYVDQYWEDHPEARVIGAGVPQEKVMLASYPYARRFSLCCPNNEQYQAFCIAQLTELCALYEFEGVNLDMMFWPAVCYCASCAERYGRELPRVVDWRCPDWVSFVRARQEWLREFVGKLTDVIRARKPACDITHQSQMYTQDWLFGASAALAKDSAWLSADLYRSYDELSFDFKLFHALSERLPFEQISSWCYPSVHEHSVRREAGELETIAALAVSNDAAIVFLEQVDPVGTVQPEGYALIKPINERIAALEPDLGGRPLRDIGIYYSFESTFDLTVEGRPVAEECLGFEPGRPAPAPEAHHRAALGVARALSGAHVPFGVVTRRDLAYLSNSQVLVLPNVVCLDEEELSAIREFVRAGGGLYASRDTSIMGTDGRERKDFGLADVFGIRRYSDSQEVITYLSPTAAGTDLLAGFTRPRPLTIHGRQALIEQTAADLTVLASLTLPYTDPFAARYASTINDPPGRFTERPALTLHSFGAGKVAYCAGALEAETHSSQRAVLVRVIAALARSPLSWHAAAPSCVEVNVYEQADRGTVTAHFVNLQDRSPVIPVAGIMFRLAYRGRTVRSARLLGSDTPLDVRLEDGHAEVTLPPVMVFASVRFDFSPARGQGRTDP